ncbi:hypothetical protein [Leifsonia xyli]|uniref:hypothetical protein n=1 Tax=Leifsonia xyli TaxID=1575 RepID=UPI003D66DA80
MSVPALSGPAPQSPGTPQKTITQLLTQWADLTNAAIAATGDTQNWYRGAIIEQKPWDPAAEDVSLAPCHTRGSDDASQVQAVVQHDAFEVDPHPIADKLTAYWESQGFTVTRTIDWTTPTGWQSVELSADRPDGVSYGLTATNDLVSIDVYTECSAHPSIDDWAEERVQKRLDDLPTPTPSPTPSTHLGQGRADTGSPTAAAAISDPTDLFREFHDAVNHSAPAAASDSTDLFREFHDDATGNSAEVEDDDGWVW